MLLVITPELTARLRAYVRRRVADPHAAEDVLQDVLVRLHQGGSTLRDPALLDPWAFRVAHNVVVDHVRARSRELPVAALPDVPADGVEAADDDEAVARLARCLPALVGRLGPADRQALELCDLGPLTQRQAAERLGLSLPGMKARVQRARQRLRAVIDVCCDVRLDARNHVVAYAPPADCCCSSTPRETQWRLIIGS